MSFLGGAECSTAGNPLTQFSKQLHNDNSLQRDRLVGRGPGGAEEGFRSRAAPSGSDQMMNDFMQQPAQFQLQPFAMEQLRRDLPSMKNAPQRVGSPGWASEFHHDGHHGLQEPQTRGMRNGGISPAEFSKFQQQRQPGFQRGASPITQAQSPVNGFQGSMGFRGAGMGPGMMMSQPYNTMTMHQPQDILSDKGKGRMVELDDHNWEAQFAEMETAEKTSISDAANAAIETELNEFDRQLGDSENFNAFNEEWDEFSSSLGLNTHDLDADFRAPGDPQHGAYIFEDDNAFLSVLDPFAEGVSILESNGNLTLAALAFEAAVQQRPDHVEALTLLGSTQAQNEKESPAIRALEQALNLDPNNLDALMSLSVSYVNEGYESHAYRTLERWLSVKYPQIISPSALSEPADLGFTDRHILHQRITDLFIQAAQLSPSGASMDPDVQVGLGVLFYGDEEFDKAVDCFSAALASTEHGLSNSKTQIHLLWNRLGATLANSGRSEDAIAAYEKALTMNPNFVRAQYNLGVSCINIGCYPQAAEHLLGALSMHRIVEEQGKDRARDIVSDANSTNGAGGPIGGIDDATLEKMVHQNESSNLYETLRRAFASMGRRDLSERVGVGMNLDQFRGEFNF